MMMKPRPGRESEIESLEDLGEHTLLRQDPAALVEALSSLFPDDRVAQGRERRLVRRAERRQQLV